METLPAVIQRDPIPDYLIARQRWQECYWYCWFKLWTIIRKTESHGLEH